MQLFNPLHSSCAKPPKRRHACPGHFSFCPSAFQSTPQPGRAGKGIGPSRAVPGLPLLQTWKLTPPGPRLLARGAPSRRRIQKTSPGVPCSPACRWQSRLSAVEEWRPTPKALQGLPHHERLEFAAEFDLAFRDPPLAPGPWPRPSQRVSARRLAAGQGRSSGRWTEWAGPGSGQKPGSAAVSALGFCGDRVRSRSSWSAAGIARVCACGVKRVRAVAFSGHRQRTFSCR